MLVEESMSTLSFVNPQVVMIVRLNTITINIRYEVTRRDPTLLQLVSSVDMITVINKNPVS